MKISKLALIIPAAFLAACGGGGDPLPSVASIKTANPPTGIPAEFGEPEQPDKEQQKQLATTTTKAVTLPTPTNLSGYTCGPGCWLPNDPGVRFNWNRVSGAASYDVNRSTVGLNGPWTLVGTVTTNLYNDKNVQEGVKYFYQVFAKSGTNTSPIATLKYGVVSNVTVTGTTTPPPPPPPPPPSTSGFAIESQGETKYLVMNWWRGDPVKEGNFRDPSRVTCTGPATTGGNCYLGARKNFRPMAFNIASSPASVAGLVMMDVPQFVDGVRTYDHYRLPIEFVKSGCTFSVRHVRTHGNLEFPLNPPGLEILPHTFTMDANLCSSYPTGAMTQTWLNSLNTALDAYLGPKVPYFPDPYPYSDPRTGKDPSTP